MPLTNAALKQKAQAFVQTIEKMSDKAKDKLPGGSYAKDYNSLRKLTADMNPDLVPVLPPVAETYQSMGAGELSRTSFAEIATYCQQIVNLLP